MSQPRFRYSYEVSGMYLMIIAMAIVAGQGDAEDQRTEIGRITLDVSQVPDELKTAGGEVKSVKMYGVQKLLQDRNAANVPSNETEAKAKLDRLSETFQSLIEGKWSEGRAPSEGGTGKSSALRDTLLAKALAKLTKKDELSIVAVLATKTKEEKKAMAASEKVAPIIAELEAKMAEVDLSAFSL